MGAAVSVPDNEEFWIVWSPEGRHPPSKRYSVDDNARREAERLARECPGHHFYVLRAESVSVEPVKTITTKLESACPF